MTASFTSTDYTPSEIVAGNASLLLGETITIEDGAALARGSILGKITVGAVPTTGTAGGGNTGGGSCGSVSGGAKTKVGVYTLTCIATATNGGRFSVTDPDGYALPEALVGVAYANGQINFTLADSGTDFAVGDAFTVTVPAGSGKYILSLSAAIDGSQVPARVLAEDVAASDSDRSGLAYRRGDFVAAALTFGTGHTAASIKDGLQAKGIYLV